MSYSVDWIASAEDRLERIWTASLDRLAVLSAVNTIDSLLAEDPYRDDAVILGNENTLIVEPLAVDYAVFEDAKRVLVLNVWMVGFVSDYI